MLEIFRRNMAERSSPQLTIAGGDAGALPLKSRSVDFVFSYSSLYYVPNIGPAIREVGRVLRPGGHAALELGNLNSLNTLV